MKPKADINRGTIQPEAVVSRIQRLFWEKKLTVSDLKNCTGWAVKRVLEYGSMEDVEIVMCWLGRERFLQLVRSVNFSSKLTKCFWEKMLELEGIECSKKYCRTTVRQF